MKIINRVLIGAEEVHAPDIDLTLEMSACGRGFITVETNIDCVNKMVRVDTGHAKLILRWFTGYVERAQPAANGTQRLFVRELVGQFDKQWPCSFQHATLRTVTQWLEQHSKLKFVLPDAPYTDKPVPNFTQSGTGYQLLDNLGRVFSIDDYCWHQMPDGIVFVGSYADSMFAKKPVEIPVSFSKGAGGGNAMSLPLIPSVRPGVIMNGQRLTTVELKNDDMRLSWLPRDSSGRALTKTPAQRMIDKAYPELAAGNHLPQLARVMGPSENPGLGQIADPFRPGYAVNVQLLDDSGNAKAGTPEYKAVPLPVPMAGNEGGMYQFPPEGTLVEVGFTGGRPDKPMVRQTLPEGNSLPAIKPGEQLQQQRAEVFRRIDAGGNMLNETDQTITERSAARVVEADQETRTVVERKTTIKANDSAFVLGTSKLMAGAVQQFATGDYTIGTMAGLTASAIKIDINAAAGISIKAGADIDISCAALNEKIAGIRKSVAAAQQLIAPSVWLGSADINVTTLMLETLDAMKALADYTAAHTHSNTGGPLNAGQIQGVSTQADQLKGKYSPIIA